MLKTTLMTVFFVVSVIASYGMFSILFEKPEAKQPVYVDYEKSELPVNITGSY